MPEQSLVARCCVVLLVSAVIGAQWQQPGTGAAKAHEDGGSHFAAGKKLIQENCIDCMGGTRAGLEHGITEVKNALTGGYPERKAAYELLADAYAEMVTYSGIVEEVIDAY